MLDIEVRAKWSASILLTLPILVMPTLDQQVPLICLFVCLFVVCLLFSGWRGLLLSGARSVPVYRYQGTVVWTTLKVSHLTPLYYIHITDCSIFSIRTFYLEPWHQNINIYFLWIVYIFVYFCIIPHFVYICIYSTQLPLTDCCCYCCCCLLVY